MPCRILHCALRCAALRCDPQVLQEMHSCGIAPDSAVYGCLVRAFAMARAVHVLPLNMLDWRAAGAAAAARVEAATAAKCGLRAAGWAGLGWAGLG